MKMSKLTTKLFAPCLLLTAFCLLFAGTTLSQTTNATLTGAVEDQDGNAVPGVKITITNPATGLERVVTSDASGSYVVPLLPPATYTVMAEANGFKRIQFPDVVLNVNDRRSLRIRLEVGDVSGVVEVRPDASLVDSESGAVATTVDRTFVGNLPLNGRSFQSLTLLTPGVVFVRDDRSPGEFSVNGQRTNSNYFTLDGVSANVGANGSSARVTTSSNHIAGQLPGLGASGSTSALVSVDALEEFKIQTSTYSAQFGRQPGGQVQLTTRSGTNDFHSTLFEYIRNEAFDARNYFNKEPARKPPTRLNQFGGTFSGPVYLPRFGEGGPALYSGRDRTFFFFSYEAQRLRLPANAEQVVPSLRLRDLAPAQFKPILNAFPLPTGDEITVSCNPTTPGCQPDGTRLTGMSRIVFAYSDPKSQDSTGLRIDHKLNEKHSLFGRYHYAPSQNFFRNLAQYFGFVSKSDQLTLGAASAFSTKVSNDIRFNISRSRSSISGISDNFGGAVPIEDISILLPGYSGPLDRVQARFGFNTSGGSADIFLGDPGENRQKQYNLVNNLSWTSGKHSIIFGFDYRHLAPTIGPMEYRQSSNVSIFSPFLEARFLDGNVNRIEIETHGSAVRPRFNNFSLFVQDTWKPLRRLTLDLGLRWELSPTPSEASGRNPVFVTDVENIANARLLRDDESWYKTHFTALAPRVGAAYLLRQRSGAEAVLRGGFGVYYDLNSSLATAAYDGFPFRASRLIPGFIIPWPITPAQAEPPSQSPTTLPIESDLYALNQESKLPYTLQWNVSLEQSIGKSQTLTVGYVAAAGRRLTTNQLLNQPLGTSDGPRPNGNFGSIIYVTNGPSSDYHSMQAQYQRRLSKGLQTIVNYTWSHAIDEVSNESQQGTWVRGNASFDIRHNFTAALTYNVPRWTRFSVVDAILRDWSFDAIVMVYSGRPLDITVSGSEDRSDGTFVTVRPDVLPGIPIWVEDGTAPGGRKINVNAFARPPFVPGTTDRFQREGTLGRNVIREPGIQQINFSVRREFSLSEKVKLQLRADAFNLFNTPILAGYSTSFTPGSTSFGRATRTMNGNAPSGGLSPLFAVGGPRSMQFSARLSF